MASSLAFGPYLPNVVPKVWTPSRCLPGGLRFLLGSERSPGTDAAPEAGKKPTTEDTETTEIRVRIGGLLLVFSLL